MARLDLVRRIWNGQPLLVRRNAVVVKLDPSRVPLAHQSAHLRRAIDGLATVIDEAGYFALVRPNAPGTEVRLVDELARRSAQSGSTIEFAELDVALEGAAPPLTWPDVFPELPKDDRFDDQWGLHRIHALAAWESERGNDSVLIGVVDSGLHLAHPDFRTGAGAPPTRFTMGGDYAASVDGSIKTMGDPHWHGTHVTGIIGATTGNGDRVAGLNWVSPIHVCTALDEDGSTSQWAVFRAVREIVLQAAQDDRNLVVNLSLALAQDVLVDVRSSPVALLREMCRLTSGGRVVLCCASGNNDLPTAVYPARYAGEFDHVVAVGATTDQPAAYKEFGEGDEWVWSGSNTDPALTLVAPGARIVSLVPLAGTRTETGTSLATAHTTGVASLVWSHARHLTAHQVVDVMTRTAWKPDGLAIHDSTWGYGRVDAPDALARARARRHIAQLIDLLKPSARKWKNGDWR